MSSRIYIPTLLAMLALPPASPGGPPTDPQPPQRLEITGGHYLVLAPPGYDPGDRPPLIFALHGTDTRASDMIGVWRTVDQPVPCLIAAPQNRSAGWQDADAELLQRTYHDLRQRFSFDPNRLLLTGHSAGGAMAMYLLYNRGFPATALATSANYLPPTVTGEQVRDHARVPLFYAVGREDINHPRMREALILLRTAGASVTVPALDIGHVLQRGVVRQAADWFGRLCARRTQATLDRAEADFQAGHLALAVLRLEEITRQRAYHPPAVAARAEDLYLKATRPANARLHAIRLQVAAGRKIDAVRDLVRLEAAYAGCRWVQAATRLRLSLEAEPDVARRMQIRRDRQRHQEARDLLAEIEALIAARCYERARTLCRVAAERYPDLPQGKRAAQLRGQLAWMGE